MFLNSVLTVKTQSISDVINDSINNDDAYQMKYTNGLGMFVFVCMYELMRYNINNETDTDGESLSIRFFCGNTTLDTDKTTCGSESNSNYYLNLYTSNSPACNGKCIYNDNGKSLNLSGLIGMSFVGYSNNTDNYIYAYSPCMNGISCIDDDGKTTSAMIYREEYNILKCDPVLAYFDEAILPEYNNIDKYWEFIYIRSHACNGTSLITVVKWYCNHNIKTASIKFGGIIDDCIYELQLESVFAC